MAPALKQRLVGAIVLVALAVIFVPMFLDGSGRRSDEKVSVEIPEQPDPPDTEFAQQADGSDGAVASADRAEATERADAAASEQPAQQQDAEATGEPAPQDGEAASADGASGESTTERSASTSDATEGPSAWVVQVGSFGRKTNAVVLRDKLREAEHDAFLEQGETDSGSVWRVRVGPVPTRERAEALQRTLEGEHELDSLVMSYPD